MKNANKISSFRKIHSVTIVANQTTQANVRYNKYYRQATITVKVNEAEPEVAVKQTGAKKITLNGTGLTETVTDYVLKRGTVAVELEKATVTATGNAASVELTTKNRLVTGEYTLQFKENEALALSVEASRMTRFDIPSDTLPLNNDYDKASGAIVSYHAYNQFEEDITKTVSTVSANSSFGTATMNPGKGTVSIAFGSSKPMLNSTGTIVLVDTSTGINYNKTLTLGMQAKADTIEVLGVFNSSTAKPMTIAEGSKNTNAALLVKVSDQYGGDLNTLDCDKDVSFSLSAGQTGIGLPDGTTTSSKFETTVDVDGVSYVAIPLSADNAKSGTAQLFFVSKTTGKNIQYTITVGANATVKTFEAYPIEDVYAGKEAEFGYNAMTEDGSAVTSYDILSSSKYGIEVSKVTVDGGSFRWVKQSDGSAKLVFAAKADAVPSNQTSKQVSVAFVTPGYTSAIITFSIQSNQRPVDIKRLKADVLTAALSGEALTFKATDFIFEDQYGNDMDGYVAVGSLTGTTEVRVITNGSINSNVIADVGGTAASGKSITVTMASISSGSNVANLSFQLYDGTTNAMIGNGCTVSLGVAVPAVLTNYEIKTSDAVFAPVSGTTIPATQHQKFEVFAYLGSRKAVIPTTYYDVLTYDVANKGVSTGAILVEVTKAAVKSNSATMSGIVTDGLWNTNSTTDTSRNVTITLGITGTAISVSKTVSASRLAPAATTISARLGVTGVTVNGDKVEIYAAENVGKGTNNTVDLSKYLVFKDQYGKDVAGMNVVISNVQSANTNSVSVSGNGTTTPVFSEGLQANDSYTATVSCGTKTVTVNVLVK